MEARWRAVEGDWRIFKRRGRQSSTVPTNQLLHEQHQPSLYERARDARSPAPPFSSHGPYAASGTPCVASLPISLPSVSAQSQSLLACTFPCCMHFSSSTVVRKWQPTAVHVRWRAGSAERHEERASGSGACVLPCARHPARGTAGSPFITPK